MGHLTELFIKSLVAVVGGFFIARVGRWIYRRFFCDQVTQFNLGDPVMQQAVITAREGLPQFWKAFERPLPGQEQFMVKVRVQCEKGEEHVWCHLGERSGKSVDGIVANRPLDVPYKRGDTITFHEEDISDWLYFYLGRPVGGETGRATEKIGQYAVSRAS